MILPTLNKFKDYKFHGTFGLVNPNRRQIFDRSPETISDVSVLVSSAIAGAGELAQYRRDMERRLGLGETRVDFG